MLDQLDQRDKQPAPAVTGQALLDLPGGLLVLDEVVDALRYFVPRVNHDRIGEDVDPAVVECHRRSVADVEVTRQRRVALGAGVR
ncbi:hypothetical protein ACFYPG_01310 [Micromonospora sp. NPDC005553]|uniref:hypothetical protein n=1 Tax=unclassified Micromonospora TaxID=2617518 RepID=UPI0033B4AAC9